MSASSATTTQVGRFALPRWRTVDIVIVAVVAAVFGVVYWAWGYFPAASIFSAIPMAAALTNAVWVAAGPLGALIVRRPGAALATELLAALFEALVSVQWSGSSIIVYGLVEGAAAELGFLLFRYRSWRLVAALVSGAIAGLAMSILDLSYYYTTFTYNNKISYISFAVIGGLLIAGLLAFLLMRSLAATGVLAPFASGREQKLV